MYRLNSTPGRAFSTLLLCIVSLGLFLCIPLLGIESLDGARYGEQGVIEPALRMVWFIGMATSLICSLKCSMSFLMNDEYIHMIPSHIRAVASTFPLITLGFIWILHLIDKMKLEYSLASGLVLVGSGVFYYTQYRIELSLLLKRYSEFPFEKIRFFTRIVNLSSIPVYLMFALLALDVLVW